MDLAVEKEWSGLGDNGRGRGREVVMVVEVEVCSTEFMQKREGAIIFESRNLQQNVCAIGGGSSHPEPRVLMRHAVLTVLVPCSKKLLADDDASSLEQLVQREQGSCPNNPSQSD